MSKVAKKNILLVGSSAAEYALAAKFSSYDMVDKVFAAPGNKMIAEYAECVDIREDSPQELLEFALKNDIYLTVASSVKAIKADIGGFFQANGQLIFAPSASGAQFATEGLPVKSLCTGFISRRLNSGYLKRNSLLLIILKILRCRLL